ncbi:hypothetical protein JCM6882_004111 [Rhodosporidiobolus microsporus]
MFKRALTLLKEHSTRTSTTAPLRRTNDPLLASPLAQHYTLPSGASFVVRPPPSSVPASHPLLPQQQQSHGASATLAAQAHESPFAAAFSSPSSSSSSAQATLLPSLSPNESALPPSRPAPPTPAHPLSPSDIASLQSLRRSSPAQWTRSALAAKFGVSPQVVGTLGWGAGSEARRVEKERREQVERRREKREEGWGWKKSIAREERRRRRSMW